MNDTGCLPCSSDLHHAIVAAFKRRDLHAFTAHLDTLSPSPDDPECMQLLIESSRDPETSEYLRVLLEKHIDPNKGDALVIAAQSDNAKGLRHLAGVKGCRIDVLGDLDYTVFHLIVNGKGKLEDKVECVKVLIENREQDIKSVINLKDERGQTAVLLAASDAVKITNSLLLKAFLKCRYIDLDEGKIGRKDKARTARQIIEENFTDLCNDLPAPRSSHEVTKNDLISYLKSNDQERFCLEVEGFDNWDDKSGQWTLLQCACQYNRCSAVKKLLKLGADPEGLAERNTNLPVIVATTKGHIDILRIFLDEYTKEKVKRLFQATRNEKETLLISLMREWQSPNRNENYAACLELLLNPDLGLAININARDEYGKSALYYAAMSTDKDLIEKLLEKGAYIGAENDNLPLKYIPRDVLEKHFNRSLDVIVLPTTSPDYKITVAYDCLVPPRKMVQPDERPKCKSIASPIPLLKRDDIEMNMTTGNEFQEQICTETEPLLFMTRNPDLRPLLKHPVLTSFLAIKWEQLKWFFYLNMLFYILFVAFITVHILFMKPRNLSDEPMNRTSDLSTESSSLNPGFYCHLWLPVNNVTDDETISLDPSPSMYIVYALSVILWGALILRECFQFVVSPRRYLSWSHRENYLELGIIFSSACVLFFAWYPRVTSATTILLAWGEMILLIGKLPALSTYIEMLKTVSHNFFKFLCWYSILILAFALSFFVLFRDNIEEDNLFVNPGMSVFKTMVMMTGEFEVGDIPFVEFPVFSHMVFVMFVFLIAIVLFNLLNGLAVSDTQEIKNDAELVGYVSRVKLIAYIERMATNHAVLSHVSCLYTRVHVFSEERPYIGHVTPNDSSHIWISPRSDDKNNVLPAKCRLNWDIVKAAEDVIAMKDRPSDMEQVKKQLEELTKMMGQMQKRLETFQLVQ